MSPASLFGCRLLPLRFAGLIFLTSSSWVFFYDPGAPQQFAATISLLLQNLLLVALFVAADGFLPRPVPRFLLAGLLGVYAAAAVADLLLLKLVSTPLASVIPILFATGSPITALTWVELTPGQYALIGLTIVGAFALGGVSHRWMPRHALLPTRARIVPLAVAAIAGAWGLEHVIARTTSAYVSRTFTLPVYLRLLPADPGHAYTIRLAPAESDRLRMLENVEAPPRPPHIVFLLLESFRADLVDPAITPNLYDIARGGLSFRRATTEAILTALSWNVILMDRPGFLFHEDRRRAEYETLAAWPLEVLHRAGYRVRICVSTDMVANDYLRRLRGTNDTVDDVYSAFDPANIARNDWDNLATDRLVQWIGEMDPDQPQYFLYQLDSTHWDYYFDPDAVVQSPYSEIVRPSRLTSQVELDLVHARYVNAARQVDNCLGRVIDALKARGVYDDTAIIVVSDHGEGFTVGQVGHSVLTRNTRSIPIIMKIPGVEPADSDAIISPRNIYPTLFSATGLRGLPDGAMLGASALPPARGEDAALTFHGTAKQADLTLDRFVLRFDVRFDGDDVTFTPAGIFDLEDVPLDDLEAHLKSLPWRETLDRLLPTVQAP
jgi:hypothetical protein